MAQLEFPIRSAANHVRFAPNPLAACNVGHCLGSNFLIRNEVGSGGDEMKPHSYEHCKISAKINKTELIEGYNWKHFPGPDGSKKCLAIFYSPVEVRPPILPYFKQTAALPCARLLINPFSDEFFQDCIEETVDLIRTIAAEYQETVHYGYSMGGYAALRFGATDSLARAIFAISPHLVLDRPASRSAQLMRGPASPRDADVRPFLDGKSDKKIFLAFSCLDVQDGVQVKDSLNLQGSNFTKTYLLEPHYLASVNKPSSLVGDWIKYRIFPETNLENTANKADIQDCTSAYEIMLSTINGSNIDLNQANLSSRLPQYYYWIGRYLYEKKQFLESLSWFARGIEMAKKFDLHLADIMISYGNALTQAGFHEPALGCYRHFREHQPPVKTAFLCEAYLLKQLDRPDELRTTLVWYENRFGTDEISIKIRAML